METKLSQVEAERAMVIVEDTIEKLEFLGSITPDVLAHREELSQLVGDEISKIIQEQRALEKRYEELLVLRSELKGLANKSKYKEVQADLLGLSKALKESTRKLAKSLRENPNVGENLMKISEERELLLELLSKTLMELQEGRFDSLMKHVKSEREAQARLEEVQTKEKSMREKIAVLEEDLVRERREHDQTMKSKREEIKQLKERLQRLKVDTSVTAKTKRMEASAKVEAKRSEYSLEEETLTKRLEDLQAKKELENMVHNQTIEFLKTQQDDLGEQVQRWEERHAKDIQDMTTKLEDLRAKRDEGFAKLQAYQKRFDEDMARAMKEEAEQRRKKELEELKAIEDEKRHLASTMLQKGLGRAFKVKMETMSKGKKGKKGKGKKGKKKK